MPTRSVQTSGSKSVSLVDNLPLRTGVILYNNTNKNLYVCFGSVADTDDFTTLLLTGSHWEVPDSYKGEVSGYSPAGVSGTVKVTVW